MPLSRSLSIFLRNALVKQHPWFSCCASCGEIRTPLGDRLCTSLLPDFPVDAVLLDAAAGVETARKLRRNFPWLRRICTVGAAGYPSVPETTGFSAAELHAAAKQTAGTRILPAAALLHLLPDMAEHYLVVGDPAAVQAASQQADFFTPNGIPLIYCREDVPLNDWASACTGHGCYAHTRRNSADFLSVPERRSEAADARGYATALFRWTYAEARAVLVPFRENCGPGQFTNETSGLLCKDLPGKSLPRDARRRALPAAGQASQARNASSDASTEGVAPHTHAPEPDPGALFLPTDSASLRARLYRRLYALCTELHPASGGCAPCGNFMPSLEKRVFHGGRPDFPVDVVYTWVDGADPAHAAERARYLREQRDIHENGLEQARFRDNEELRYSLRALEHCAPWVRSVILATDRQIPAWLKRDHPSVRVADHTEFIPARFLPTFNSHVIEAWLHEIPGLAEHYIYLNDDVFLARPCRKTEFFTPNGLPLAFTDWRKRRLFGYAYTKTPHAQSYFNTLRILRERGVPTDPKFITAHGPYPQTRINAAEAFAFYKDVIEGFAGNRFRTTGELALYSHALPLLLYHKKRLVPCDERYYYVQTRRRDRAAYYKAVLQSRRDGAPPLFFCINDVGGRETRDRRGERHTAPVRNGAPGQRPDADDGQWRRDLRELLEAYYPDPSGFETAAPLPDGEAVTM